MLKKESSNCDYVLYGTSQPSDFHESHPDTYIFSKGNFSGNEM
jgi:hypothetical protein